MENFFYIYILLSLKDKEWYIGFTSDLTSRIKMHNMGQNISTRNRIPLELIYFEGYKNKLDALGREKFLKSGSGHQFIKKQIKNYLVENHPKSKSPS